MRLKTCFVGIALLAAPGLRANEMASTAVYDFTNGATPLGPLLAGANGSFYGVTQAGGSNGVGSVYALSAAGALTLLYSFTTTSPDGNTPAGGLAAGADGNYYGVTQAGGANADGTIFRISSAGSYLSVHSFSSAAEGANPNAPLTRGNDGLLYGSFSSGGSANAGAIFKFDPQSGLTPLYSFTNGLDGGSPGAGIIQAGDHNFYGTTSAGGAGYGTIFRITSGGVFTPIYTFTNGLDGAACVAPLTLGADGSLFGCALSAGFDRLGTIFNITLAGKFTVLHVFDFYHGYFPTADLVLGTDGNFYGTTPKGGTSDFGIAFSMSPSGAYLPIVTFREDLGSFPEGSLIQGSDGNFYGVATGAGTFGGGSIFRFSGTVPFPGLGQTLPPSEFSALVDLYNSAGGKHWYYSQGWPEGSVSSWYGVTVSDAVLDTNWQATTPGHVLSLALGGNNLMGVLPDSITNLIALQTLVMDSQLLTGPIPDGLGNLRGLELMTLRHNSLTSLPDSVTNLVRLQILELDQNNIASHVPVGLGSLTNLAELNLPENRFTGSLPPSLTNLTELSHLDVSQNLLSGTLPEGLGDLTNVAYFNLQSNLFSGALPDSITNLIASQIYFNDNDFSGPIPAGLGNLRANFLELYDNELTGAIPASIAHLTNASLLLLENNRLTGPIPSGLGALPLLQQLNVAGNFLTGSIPTDLTNATLTGLWLEHNHLTGSIPSSLEALTSLHTLDLSFNFLSGQIPNGLGSPSLTYVNLSANDLTGPMPASFGNLNSGGELHVENNFLTGPIPSALPSYVYLENNDFDVTPGSPDELSITLLMANHYGAFYPQNSQLNSNALQLVLNGGFEAGSFTNWFFSGNDALYVYVNTSAQNVHSGAYGAELGPSGSSAFMAQRLATLPGVTYQISLWLNNPDEFGFDEFSVYWDETILFDGYQIPAVGWTNLLLQAVASTNDAVLQFQFRNDNSYFGLDDITVTVAPPQPQVAVISPDTISLSWNTAPPWSYRLDSSPDLNHWTLGQVIPATGSCMTASANVSGAGLFYRVVMIPPAG